MPCPEFDTYLNFTTFTIFSPLPTPTSFPPREMALTTNPPTASIWSRKLDLLYLTFFLIHLPIMFRKPALVRFPSFPAPPSLLSFPFTLP